MYASAKKNSVLVVCEEGQTADFYGKSLGKEINALFAKNIQDVQQLIKQEASIKLIIVDMPVFKDILLFLKQSDVCCDIPVVVLEDFRNTAMVEFALNNGAADIWHRPISELIVYFRVKNLIQRSIKIDVKTGLFTQEAFLSRVDKVIHQNTDKVYYLIRYDIDNFKLYNHAYGNLDGDDLLKWLGKETLQLANDSAIFCRFEKDHFMGLVDEEFLNNNDLIRRITHLKYCRHHDFRVVIRMGIYKVDDRSMSVLQMCDRTLLALNSIKNNASILYAFYCDSMLHNCLVEQQIIDEMDYALASGQFIVYLQPQYNQMNNSLYGAEALVRWNHPIRGMISPGVFIPIFEKNGFIAKLDRYVFEEVCKLQRRWLDSGMNVVPISVNLSRVETQNEYLCEELLGILKKYHLRPKHVNLEITESAYMDNPKVMIGLANSLREAGFELEMDDFGSGYSSLNTLKDIPVDALKLDLKFLYGDDSTNRGTHILSSIIRMAHSMRMSIIAEGVETKEQADFLKSLGCINIQGYYFDRPMPVDQFEGRLKNVLPDVMRNSKGNFDRNEEFQSQSSMMAPLLSEYVGAAGFIEYDGKKVEGIRFNQAFFRLLASSEQDVVAYFSNMNAQLDSENWILFESAIKRAIASKGESECDIESMPNDNLNKPAWIRARFRFISQNEQVYTLYIQVQSVEKEKETEQQLNSLQKEHKALLSSLPGGALFIGFFDNKLQIFRASEGMAAMLGYTYDEYMSIHGNNVFETTHPDDRAELEKRVYAAIVNDDGYLDCSCRLRCKSGKYAFVHIYCQINTLPDGSKYGSCVVLDMGEQFRKENHPQKLADESQRQGTTSDWSLASVASSRSDFFYRMERIELGTQSKELDFVFDTLKSGVFKYDTLTDQITFMGPSVLKMLGYTQEEFYRKFDNSFRNMVWKDDKETIFKMMEQDVAQKKEDLCGTFRVQTKSGSLKWVRVTGCINTEEDGYQWFLGIISDYDIGRAYEQEHKNLQESVNLLESNFDGGIVRYRVLGNRFSLSSISPKYLESLGYTEEELFRLTEDDNFTIFHPDDRRAVAEAVRDALLYNKKFRVQSRVLRKDGSVLWVISHGTLVGKPDNGYFFVMSHDITALKTLEDSSRVERERLNLILNSVPAGIATYEMRPGGFLKVLFVSRGMTDLFGMSEDDYRKSIESSPYLGEFGPDADVVKKALEDIEKFGKPFEISYRAYHGNGSLLWYSLKGVKVGERNGNPLILGIFQNQSKNTVLMNKILENADFIVTVYERETLKMLFANSRAEQFAGKVFNPKESQEVSEFLYGQTIEEHCDSDFVSDEYDVTRNGKSLHVRRVRVMWDGVDSVIMFVQDVSPKMAFNKRLFKLINTVAGALTIFKYEGNGNIMRIFLSERAKNLLHCSTEVNAIKSIDEICQLVHPDDLSKLKQALLHGLTYKEPMVLEYRRKSGEDSYQWIELRINPIENEEDGLLFYGIYTDITAQKRLDDELHNVREKDETRFKRLISCMQVDVDAECLIGGYVDADFTYYYANQKMAQLLGYADVDEMVRAIDGKVSKTIHPDDMEMVMQDVGHCTKAGDSYKTVYRMPKKDGSWIWTLDYGTVIETEDGSLVIISRCTDISKNLEKFHKSLRNG